MLDICNVSKVRGGTPILSNVSFSARPGRVTAFLGPNGAGKSSTLRILLGLDRPSSGQALVAGREYRSIPRPRCVVGSMLDGSGAHRSRTARAHLLWMAQASGIPKSRVDEVLDEVGLTHARRMKVGQFSLGMGQRLGLAGALLGAPQALVLDEPVNGLDPEGIRWMRRLLREFAERGGTVLLSSHLMSEVAEVADDVVMIAGGTVVADGPTAEVTAGYASLEDAFFAITEGGRR